MVLGNQPTNKPTNKVTSATIFGAIAAILSWADDEFWNNKIPGPVEAAFITVVVFVAGYFTRNASPDAPPEPVVVPEDEVGD